MARDVAAHRKRAVRREAVGEAANEGDAPATERLPDRSRPDNGGISSDPWPKRRPVTGDRVKPFAAVSQGVLQHARGTASRDLPGYGRVILAADACGFVCGDFGVERPMAVMARVGRNPAVLSRMPFRRMRLYVHGSMRAERWSDCGSDHGTARTRRPRPTRPRSLTSLRRNTIPLLARFDVACALSV